MRGRFQGFRSTWTPKVGKMIILKPSNSPKCHDSKCFGGSGSLLTDQRPGFRGYST